MTSRHSLPVSIKVFNKYMNVELVDQKPMTYLLVKNMTNTGGT